jgi:phosphomevalonate kinase
VRVIAPGKLVLTGAYAVLEGAPAIVAAVDRYAIADTAAPEAPDATALHDASGRKLGLGSSSASQVASLAARAVARGDDIQDSRVRAGLFRAARRAHATAQGGGSGADVAAAVHGGVLRYSISGEEGSEAVVRGVRLPSGVVWAAFWSGTSARTSDLVGRVAAHRKRKAGALRELHRIADCAARCVDSGDGAGFVSSARDYGRALAALGHEADAPIVPFAFAELASHAVSEGGAFLPSGAGGGDVAVWIANALPSRAFVARAEALSMYRLDLRLDSGGVRIHSLDVTVPASSDGGRVAND